MPGLPKSALTHQMQLGRLVIVQPAAGKAACCLLPRQLVNGPAPGRVHPAYGAPIAGSEGRFGWIGLFLGTCLL